MSLSSSVSEKNFQNYIQGTFGNFSTPAGQVNYLLTKARLGGAATDPERRLTQHLAPVREVLAAEELDFSQLLQRDLDDHRVAVNLIHYLLTPDWTGPAFFPPVVAIVLPFDDQRPSVFPSLEKATDLQDDGLFWRQQDAGNFVRTRRLLTDKKELHQIPLGQLHWNGEFCRMLVVDGQHRAMALLAIERTIRSTWKGSGGERFRYFYENRVKELLRENKVNLDDIELPVAVLWFPDKFGKNQEPHKAARKLFVDVNKEARRPSESRLILLSDTELVNIFTRSTLTELRNESTAYMPLYCVEYDNPDSKTTQSARWSAMTNIHILKQMVNRAVFGPPKYITDMTAAIGKKEPEAEKNAYMRVLLNVEELFPPILDGDEGFQRNDLGNDSFPESAVAALSEAYLDTWGQALLILLSGVHPFAAHARALTRLKEDWLPDDAIAQLAQDALFNGVGMFWTLRDSANYYRDSLPPGKKSSEPKPDVVKAWELLGEKQEVFESLRAEELLGDASKSYEANLLFQSVNTHACQLGLSLTLGSVCHKAVLPGVGVVELARAMVEGINAWMTSKTSGEYDRRLALAKPKAGWPKNALNAINNMDAPRAVQFRYFWIEILSSEQASSVLDGVVNPVLLLDMRDEARRGYIRYIAGEKLKALKVAEPFLSDSERSKKSQKQAAADLRTALMRWFGMQASDWDEWEGVHDGPESIAEATVDDVELLDDESVEDDLVQDSVDDPD